MKQCFCILASLATFVGVSLAGQDSGRSASHLVGDWRGTSICQVRESACRDEDSLYHVVRIEGKANRYSMNGEKIVDGKAVSMGAVECTYDGAKAVLTCDLPQDVLRFMVEGNKMEGTMTRPDGTLWRKLSLTKVASAKTSGRRIYLELYSSF